MLSGTLRVLFRCAVVACSSGKLLTPVMLETLLLGSVAVLGVLFLVAVLAIKGWVPGAIGLFLLLAPLNYFYVLVFDWQITWAYAGTISEGAPALAKYAKDIVFLVIFLAWLLTLLTKKPGRQIQPHLLDRLVGLFIGYQVIMVIPAIAKIGLAPSLTALWLNSGYILMYIMMRTVFSRIDVWQVRMWASRMLLLGGGIALIGFWQFLRSPSVVDSSGLGAQTVVRAYSTMGSPNNLGMYLCILLLISLMWGLYRESFLKLVATLLVVGCLLLTVSMSSFFGAVLVVGLFMVKRKNWRSLLFTVGLIATSMALIDSLVPAVGSRVVASLMGEDQSWLLRVINWNQLWPTDFWALMYGAGGGVSGMTVSFSGIDLLADNQYLAVILQFGVVGIVIYGTLLAAGGRMALRESLRIWMPYSTKSEIAAGLLVILVAIWGSVVNILNVFPINAYFWSALAMVASSARGKVRASA